MFTDCFDSVSTEQLLYVSSGLSLGTLKWIRHRPCLPRSWHRVEEADVHITDSVLPCTFSLSLSLSPSLCFIFWSVPSLLPSTPLPSSFTFSLRFCLASSYHTDLVFLSTGRYPTFCPVEFPLLFSKALLKLAESVKFREIQFNTDPQVWQKVTWR